MVKGRRGWLNWDHIIVVPEGFKSSTLLSVKYPKSGEDVAVGNFIKPSDSADEPEVSFVASDEKAHYTLLMVTQTNRSMKKIDLLNQNK